MKKKTKLRKDGGIKRDIVPSNNCSLLTVRAIS